VNPGGPGTSGRGTRTVPLGQTGIELTRVGVGGGPLGNLFTVVTELDARELVRDALRSGIRYFDTAPVYGMGLAETRLGQALAGTDRAAAVISTKVGRILSADAPPDPGFLVDGEPIFRDTPPVNPLWDFSFDGVLTSLQASLERLGLDRVDIAFLHEPTAEQLDQAATEGYRALRHLRNAGAVAAIGVGWDEIEPMADLVAGLEMDCILLAGRYTLLDQSALDRLLPLCAERGTGVIVGGVFNSGILAATDGPFEYLPAGPEVRARVEQITRHCDRFDVPLRAAALQFPLAHPAVVSVVLGMRSVAELRDNLRMLDVEIPAGLWTALRRDGLLPHNAPTPEPGWR
jgi:D-threo-aldose 1-dehydrogenase